MSNAKTLALPDVHTTVKIDGKPLYLSEDYRRVLASVETPEQWDKDLDTMRRSIHLSGIDDPVLVRDCGEYWLLMDGYRRAIAYHSLLEGGLNTDVCGKPITLKIRVYDGPDDDSSVIARIIRANLSRRQLGERQKRDLILFQLALEARQGIFRTGNWVAEELGVSQTWLNKVRNDAIEAGKLPPVAKYRDRKGRQFPANLVREPAKVETARPATVRELGDTVDIDATTETPAAAKAIAPPANDATEPSTETSSSTASPAPVWQPDKHPVVESVRAIVRDVVARVPEVGEDVHYRQIADSDPETISAMTLGDLDNLLGRIGVDADQVFRALSALVQDVAAPVQTAPRVTKSRAKAMAR